MGIMGNRLVSVLSLVVTMVIFQAEYLLHAQGQEKARHPHLASGEPDNL
jgi:hypothetical protein